MQRDKGIKMSKTEEMPVIEAKYKFLEKFDTTRKKQKHWQINKEKFLSDSEYGRLRLMVRKDTRRYAILLKLYMFTGARAHEGLAVRFKNLDKDTKSVFIFGLKGSNDREIPLPPWYFLQLYNYAKRNCKNQDAKIFPFTYTILNRIWHYYRPVKKRFHSLRHTIAIKVFKDTRDIKLVQILLGHRNIKNTMVYLDYVYSQNEMKRILKVKY